MAVASSSGPRWKRLPEQRPRQILEAALGVFGEQGFVSARLDDVAARAGVSKGTIYLYFSSKDELFAEMIRHALGGLIEDEETRGDASSAAEELVALLRHFWTHLRSPTFETVHRLILAERHNFPELARSYARTIAYRGTGLLSAAVHRGIREGEFRSVDPDAVARMLLALLVKHAMWCAQPEFWPRLGPEDADRVFREILDFTQAALHHGAPDTRTRATP